MMSDKEQSTGNILFLKLPCQINIKVRENILSSKGWLVQNLFWIQIPKSNLSKLLNMLNLLRTESKVEVKKLKLKFKFLIFLIKSLYLFWVLFYTTGNHQNIKKQQKKKK